MRERLIIALFLIPLIAIIIAGVIEIALDFDPFLTLITALIVVPAVGFGALAESRR